MHAPGSLSFDTEVFCISTTYKGYDNFIQLLEKVKRYFEAQKLKLWRIHRYWVQAMHLGFVDDIVRCVSIH